ncbi:MAG: TetR family transcriptional regulator [Calothrix sp. FI2-JRJ7]|jgi:AcrR family transcriptional regulator|nr:TetR family transcriptional regulator [Calothrix sp. FI2-JRJ7]
MPEVENTSPETRDLILATAEAHLRRFGYARTTVSEIARACGMSHANVYRFFKTKADIIDAVVARALGDTEKALAKVMKQSKPASELLEAYILELYRSKRSQASTDPEIFEALSAILQAHRNVIEQHLVHIYASVKEILNRGAQSGEFKIIDIDRATHAVLDATLKFRHPLLMADANDSPTEEQVTTVAKLLIAALSIGFI